MVGLIILVVYVAVFVGAFFAVKYLFQRTVHDFTSLKTVTFGDESAVRPNRIASVVSVLTLFLIWGSFTGSSLLPGFLHAPGPFVGDTSFTYTLEDAEGAQDDATVFVQVVDFGLKAEKFEVDAGEGFAKDDAVAMNASRSTTIIFDKNDETTRKDGAKIVAINGEPISAGNPVRQDVGRFALTDKGAISFTPPTGLQMEPIWLPSPEDVLERAWEILWEGYRDSSLLEHLGISLYRVLMGFVFGCIVGIPLGYAMGLSDWFRGWFDPIVEFMRPVPPLLEQCADR